MLTRILRLGPEARPPFATPADAERWPADENLLVIHQLWSAQSLGGWWPLNVRTTLQGRVHQRMGDLIAEHDEQGFALVEGGPGPEAEVTLGEEAMLVTLMPARCTLERLVEPGDRQHADYPVLFAAHYGRDQRAWWMLRQLATECFVAPEPALDDRGITERLVAAVKVAQAPLEALVERCPGRRMHHRRDLFARLQRVRALLEARFTGDLNVGQMASIASLSPTHFIRVYRQVFDETPHRTLARAKLRLAAGMLADGGRTITEVSRLLGFENRCAFARWYRQETGESASAARARLRAALPAVAEEGAAGADAARRAASARGGARVAGGN